MTVEQQGASDRARGTTELRLPESVTHDGDAGAAPDVVAARDRPAEHRAHTEHAEEVSADLIPVNTPRFAAGGEVVAGIAIRERGREEVATVADLLPERIREHSAAVLAHRHLQQRLGVAHRKRLEHHGVDQREDRRVGSDAEAEGKDGDEGEAAIGAEGTYCLPDIGEERVEPREGVDVAGAFLQRAAVAKASLRFATGCVFGHSRGDKVIRALGQVKADLAVEVARVPVGAQQVGEAAEP